jgi:hypothetical protein
MPDTHSDGSAKSDSTRHSNGNPAETGVAGAPGPGIEANADIHNPYVPGEHIENVTPARRMSLVEFLFGMVFGIFLGVSAGIGTCVTGVSALYGIGFSENTAMGPLFLPVFAGSVIISAIVFVKVFESFRGVSDQKKRDSGSKRGKSPQ